MNSLFALRLANVASNLLRAQCIRPMPVEVATRFRARHSTRLKREAIKAKRKAQLASNPKPPYVPFMHKVMEKLMQGRLPPEKPIESESSSFTHSTFSAKVANTQVDRKSLSLAWPSRLLHIAASKDAPVPDDDVFLLSNYHYTPPFEEALAFIRQVCDPMIYDDPNAPIIMRLDLNMNMDLNGKEFVENFKDMLVLPHYFEIGKKRVVMAFTQNPDAQMAAREAGADFVGGTEVIRKIKRGEMKVDEVDCFVANLDIVNELAGIRGILNDKLPTQGNGLLGLDVIPLVKHYSRAVTFGVKQDEDHPEWGVCQVAIGRLSMSDEELAENASSIIKRLSNRRPLALSLGHFIHRAAFVSAEHRTHVAWAHELYSPPLPDNDAALQAIADAAEADKGKRKKKKKKIVPMATL